MQKQFAFSALMKGVIESEFYKVSTASYGIQENELSASNSIDEFALSIRNNGLLNPVIVRTVKTGFEIVTVNIRYLTFNKLGLSRNPYLVGEVNEREVSIYFAENIQRKILDPVEECQLIKPYVLDYEWGGLSELSNRISQSISHISKRIAFSDLLNELYKEIKGLI